MSTHTTTPILRPSSRQQGVTLFEVLIAIVIFSIGILAILGLQAASIKNSSAAKYRTDASYLANQLLGQLWSNRAALEANPTQFAHRPTGGTGAGRCAPTGTAATHAAVTGWLTDVQGLLPGATAAMQQVRIEASQRVIITICWQIPGETTPRNHIEVAQLVGSGIGP